MGMFDDLDPWTEHFKEGEPFDLEAAKLGPVIDTEFGASQSVQLRIGGKWYSIFGQGMVSQVERMDRADLPARVGIVRRQTRGGQQVKLIVPENKISDTDEIPF